MQLRSGKITTNERFNSTLEMFEFLYDLRLQYTDTSLFLKMCETVFKNIHLKECERFKGFVNILITKLENSKVSSFDKMEYMNRLCKLR